MCMGNHDSAKIVDRGLKSIHDIVRDFDGIIPADLDSIGRDLHATVLANELRFLAVQAYTEAVHAVWALTVKRNRYVLLAPESIPRVALLRRARWRVVIFRRHLVAALNEDVLACAGLAEDGDLFHRWEPADALQGPERKSGVVVHMPHEAKPGIVRGENGSAAEPVELELTPRDARSYTHCRDHHYHHPVGERSEGKCACLRPGDAITYIPMRRFPSQVPVAFLVSRDPPPTHSHLSGIGLTPAQRSTRAKGLWHVSRPVRAAPHGAAGPRPDQ